MNIIKNITLEEKIAIVDEVTKIAFNSTTGEYNPTLVEATIKALVLKLCTDADIYNEDDSIDFEKVNSVYEKIETNSIIISVNEIIRDVNEKIGFEKSKYVAQLQNTNSAFSMTDVMLSTLASTLNDTVEKMSAKIGDLDATELTKMAKSINSIAQADLVEGILNNAGKKSEDSIGIVGKE